MAYFGPVNTSLDRSIICHSLSLLLSKLPNHLLFIPILLIPAELYSFKCIYRFCQFVCLFGFYIKAAHQCHILMSHMGKMRGVHYDGVFHWPWHRHSGTRRALSRLLRHAWETVDIFSKPPANREQILSSYYRICKIIKR